MHFLVCCLLVLLATTTDATSVQPTFTCWYTSYTTGTPVPTVILGYANTAPSNTSATSINIITPVTYNGEQPTIFRAGVVPYAAYIGLIARDTLKWTIDGASLIVTPENLNEATRCINTDYATRCPTSVTNFCDDGSYCNGNEFCFADTIGGPVGACHRTTESVICSTGLICSETRRACIAPVTLPPPTYSPTSAPTTPATGRPTSASPTNAPTTKAPTNAPTNVPTVLPRPVATETVCQSDSDCVVFNNFCDGVYVCNELTSTCIEADSNYDPCTKDRALLRDYYATEVNQSVRPVSVVCNEGARLCIESVSCQFNMDCSDGLVCNGEEQCVAGECYYQRDRSMAAICHTTMSATCSEPDGCVLVGDEAHTPANHSWNHTGNHTRHHSHHIDPALLGIVVGAITLIGLMVVFGFLYFEFNKPDSAVLPSSVNQQQSMKRPFAGKIGRKFNNKYGVKMQ